MNKDGSIDKNEAEKLGEQFEQARGGRGGRGGQAGGGRGPAEGIPMRNVPEDLDN